MYFLKRSKLNKTALKEWRTFKKTKLMKEAPDIIVSAETYIRDLHEILKGNYEDPELHEPLEEFDGKKEVYIGTIQRPLTQLLYSFHRKLLGAARQLPIPKNHTQAKEYNSRYSELIECANSALNEFTKSVEEEFKSFEVLHYKPFSVRVGWKIVIAKKKIEFQFVDHF